MDPLREEEGKRAAILGRLRVEQENFEREAARAAERERELRARTEQLGSDTAREEALIGEARQILSDLGSEIEALAGAEAKAGDGEREARARLDSAQEVLRAAEAKLAELTTSVAEHRARKQNLESSLAERAGQRRQARRGSSPSSARRRARSPGVRRMPRSWRRSPRRASSSPTRSPSSSCRRSPPRIRRARSCRWPTRAREESGKARLRLASLRTERETLVKLLIGARHTDFPPILDRLRVKQGYEAALGAALGDDLDAPAAEEAAVHWRHVEVPRQDPALPAGVEPLATHVEAPPELDRRLRQTGIVAGREQGHKLQPALKPGQRLVTRAGDLWRWDGYTAAAEGAAPAAQRLAERNRLSSLELEEAEARTAAATASDTEREASEALTAARAEEQRLRKLGREAQGMLAKTRESLTAIERAARDTESKLAAVSGARARAEEELVVAKELLEEAEQAMAAFAAAEDLEPALLAAKTEAETRRTGLAEARARAERHRARAPRPRRSRCGHRHRARALDDALGRRRAADRSLEGASHRGAARAGRARRRAGDDRRKARQADERAGRRRAQPSSRRRRAGGSRHGAESRRAGAARRARRRRRRRVRAARAPKRGWKAHARAARTCRGISAKRSASRRKAAWLWPRSQPGAILPPLADVERKVANLKADRERLGGVNLGADEELQQLSIQAAGLDTEKADVENAIAKLRGAIGQLNREAHKRLQEAFEAVNAHFGKLFTTLFGGGEARLEMIEGEDPLEGGLEIIAKPPGKKPATLSLLSGGEQSLTAMSLIFAVFLTNPSPICVLDEVDAPLDDANVDRFCHLLETMAEETATRFLVITHHPMTMSRMSRLFGVTMAEKGISQLVSVDLQTAQRFREAG